MGLWQNSTPFWHTSHFCSLKIEKIMHIFLKSDISQISTIHFDGNRFNIYFRLKLYWAHTRNWILWIESIAWKAKRRVNLFLQQPPNTTSTLVLVYGVLFQNYPATHISTWTIWKSWNLVFNSNSIRAWVSLFEPYTSIVPSVLSMAWLSHLIWIGFFKE